MEKIVHLKRLTKTIDKEQVDDFAWLQPQSKRQFWTEASSVHNLSKSLQSLALNAKPVSINDGNSHKWTKKKDLLKFAALVLEENYNKYKTMRTNLLCSKNKCFFFQLVFFLDSQWPFCCFIDMISGIQPF